MEHPKLMIAAVRAYHRSSDDSFARLSEFLGVCKAEDFPRASHRVRIERDPTKLWGWAMNRWGRNVWPELEYSIREAAVDFSPTKTSQLAGN